MKKVFIVLTLASFASCEKTSYVAPPYEVVDETYVHKYGFEVAPQEWQERGEHGQKITTLKNGITVTESYNFGQKEGDTTYSYPYQSNINKVERYKAGNIVEEEYLSMEGKPTKKIVHENNGTKKVTGWYDGGHPQLVESYNGNFLQNGDYYTLNGSVESKVTDGNGIRIDRDLSGKLNSKDTIVNGAIFEKIGYWPNGTPKEVVKYQNGMPNGHRRTFDEGGEPLTDEEIQNGVQNGITLVYQNGEKFALVPYKNGVKQGIEKRFRDGKDLFEEISWDEGRQTGPSKTYLNK